LLEVLTFFFSFQQDFVTKYEASHQLVGIIGKERDINPNNIAREPGKINKETRSACAIGWVTALGYNLSLFDNNSYNRLLETTKGEIEEKLATDETRNELVNVFNNDKNAMAVEYTNIKLNELTNDGLIPKSTVQIQKDVDKVTDFCKLIHGDARCIFWQPAWGAVPARVALHCPFPKAGKSGAARDTEEERDD